MKLLLAVVGIVAALSIVWLDETSGQQPGSAARRDQVVIFLREEPDTLNPLFSSPGGTISPSEAIEAILFTSTAHWDPAGRLLPQGVEHIPSLKDGTWRLNGEEMTLLWKLRRRAWDDGRPVTCGDYVFAYNVTRNKQVPPISFGYEEAGRRIAHIVCPQSADGREVAVTWKARTITARETIIGGFPVPRHLLERPFRANPSALDKAPYGTEPRATVGDGAYRLAEWRRGHSITVEAVNDHPIFGTPRIKRIVFRMFPGVPPGAPRAALIFSGEVDILPDIAPPVIRVLKQQAADHIRILTHPALAWEHIDFNLDNLLLQDVRVRRAIAHAVNRTQIVQQVLLGYAGVTHSYWPPGHPGYTADVRQYPYDPARARALLREAGFAPGADGVLRNANGQRLALELSTTADRLDREQIARIIQQQLREVGVDIAIVNYPARVFFGEFIDHRKFTGLALYTSLFDPSRGCDEMYTSDGIPSESNGWKGQNFPGYRNAEMDEVCKAAHQEFDESRRNQLLRQSARIFSRDLPALPLHVRYLVAAVRAGLENLTPTADPPFTWNAHTWYWK